MLAEVASAATITKEGFAFLNSIKEMVGSDVVSGYFKYDGTKIEGSNIVEVEINEVKEGKGFWMEVG